MFVSRLTNAQFINLCKLSVLFATLCLVAVPAKKSPASGKMTPATNPAPANSNKIQQYSLYKDCNVSVI